MRAILIPADESKAIRLLDWHSLDDLQSLVGGYIETMPFRQNVAPFFNEEGKLMLLPLNPRATKILRDELGAQWPVWLDEGIVGDCLFTGFDVTTGDEMDVPEEFIKEVMG